jgi:hypothetical protein
LIQFGYNGLLTDGWIDPWFIHPVPDHLGFDSRRDRLINGMAVQIRPWTQEKLKGWIKFIRPFYNFVETP